MFSDPNIFRLQVHEYVTCAIRSCSLAKGLGIVLIDDKYGKSVALLGNTLDPGSR